MKSSIVYFSFLATVAIATNAWADIPDGKFPDWIQHFRECGKSAQAVEDWPGLGLVKEYQSLKENMLHDAEEKGASGEQLIQLSEAFELGRQEVKETGWRDDMTLEGVGQDELNEVIGGMRENRIMCSEY